MSKILNTKTHNYFFCYLTVLLFIATSPVLCQNMKIDDKQTVKDEHSQIGNETSTSNTQHTNHKDAQWFPEAGMGLFLHWDQASTVAMGIGWSMIPGRPLSKKRITDSKELAHIVRESDYDLNGKKWPITPNEYWALTKNFHPDDFHPELWLKKAKEAGFTYVVFTTKHHSGFALWPSAYGNFSTKNTMGGRDLVKEFVDGARAAGLKVGLYFSGPDWYFDRDYMNFMYGGAAKLNPELPLLDPDLKPRILNHTSEELKAHYLAYAAMVRGQIEELLTNYGKIDVMWFDGKPSIPSEYNPPISLDRIHQLQPGIVVNGRMHGKSDFITPERVLPEDLRLKSDEWGEYCLPWNHWSYNTRPFIPFNRVLTELVRGRNAGVNCLFGFGPMPSGNLAPQAYEYMDKLSAWIKINGEAIYGTRALPDREKSSALASAKGKDRYIYFGTTDNKTSEKIESPLIVTFTGLKGEYSAQVIGEKLPCSITTNGNVITLEIPASVLGQGVKVIKLTPKK